MGLCAVLTWITLLVEFTVAVPAHQHMNERPIRAISVGEKRCFFSRKTSVESADPDSSSAESFLRAWSRLYRVCIPS